MLAEDVTGLQALIVSVYVGLVQVESDCANLFSKTYKNLGHKWDV
jgi:hypothetical protein